MIYTNKQHKVNTMRLVVVFTKTKKDWINGLADRMIKKQKQHTRCLLYSMYASSDIDWKFFGSFLDVWLCKLSIFS